MLFVLLAIRIPLSKVYEEKLKIVLNQKEEIRNNIRKYEDNLREYYEGILSILFDDVYECHCPPNDQTKIQERNRLMQKLAELHNNKYIIQNEIGILRQQVAEARLNEIIPKIDKCECDDVFIKKLKEKFADEKIEEI